MSEPRTVKAQEPQTGTSGRDRDLRILTSASLVVLLILALAFSFRQIDSPDIGLHLAPGKWMLAHRAFPAADVFTYGAMNHEYVDLYWLYQVVMALFDRLGGAFLLVLANAFFIVGAFIVLYRRSSPRPGSSSVLPLLLLFLIVFTANYEIRPHVVSWLYLGLLLAVWERFYEDAGSSLVPVPIVMALWVNTQPTFILGWLVIVCFWLSLTLRDKHIGRKATLYAALGLAAPLLNPYFLRGIAIPFVQFGFLQQASVFKGLIAEYSPLPFFPGPDDYTYFGSLLLLRPMFVLQLVRIAVTLGVLIQLVRGKLRIHEALLFVSLFYLNSIAEKNIGYYLIGVAPFLVRSFDRGGPPVRLKSARSTVGTRLQNTLASTRARMIVIVCVMAASLIITARVVSNDFYSTQRLSHRFGYAYNNLFLPVQAAEYINRHQLDGTVFNHIDFGGYLLDHIPQKIYIDARNEVMGEDLAREYLQTNSTPGLRHLLDRYKPDIVLFPHKDGANWLECLHSDTSRWRLVYFDELAAIYLRNGYATILPALDQDSIMRSLGEIPAGEMDSVLNRSFQRGLFDQFVRDQYFPVRESELSAFCSDNSWDRLAIRFGVEAIHRSTIPCPELFYNLSIYFQNVGDKERAEFCLKRASE